MDNPIEKIKLDLEKLAEQKAENIINELVGKTPGKKIAISNYEVSGYHKRLRELLRQKGIHSDAYYSIRYGNQTGYEYSISI